MADNKCPECGGKGHVYYMNLQEHSPCPTCYGTGEKKLDELGRNEDSRIVGNMKDYWKHQRCGAE